MKKKDQWELEIMKSKNKKQLLHYSLNFTFTMLKPASKIYTNCIQKICWMCNSLHPTRNLYTFLRVHNLVSTSSLKHHKITDFQGFKRSVNPEIVKNIAHKK